MSVDDVHRNRPPQAYRFGRGPNSEHSPEPRRAACRATMAHERATEAIRVHGFHSQATVRLGVADGCGIIGAVDVVVRFLEEDLHQPHGICARAGCLVHLAGRSLFGRRHPGWIPHQPRDPEPAGGRGMFREPNRDGVSREGVPAYDDEQSATTQVGHEMQRRWPARRGSARRLSSRGGGRGRRLRHDPECSRDKHERRGGPGDPTPIAMHGRPSRQSAAAACRDRPA